MNLDVSLDDLCAIIGQLYVQNRINEFEIARLRARVEELEHAALSAMPDQAPVLPRDGQR